MNNSALIEAFDARLRATNDPAQRAAITSEFETAYAAAEKPVPPASKQTAEQYEARLCAAKSPAERAAITKEFCAAAEAGLIEKRP